VIGLDNTKADITYVDSQDDDLSDRITLIETTGGIDFIKVANFASLPSSGDARNHRLFMTIDTKQLWEWDGSQWNESSPTDLTDITVSANSGEIALTIIGDSTRDESIIRINDGLNNIVANMDGLGNLTLEKDLFVEGNLTVNGTTTTVNTTTVAIEDNIILINSNQTGTPSPTLKGGIEIERGDSTNYQFIFDESDDRFKIGQVGSLQTVATRQDDGTVVANGIPFYNNTEKRFDTSSVLTWSSATGRVSASQLFASNAIFTPYVASANGQPSSSINFASTGTTISRDINDANHTLIVNNIHASSTGNIANFQWQGTNRLEITRDGFLNQNGTRLLHTQNTSTTAFGLNSLLGLTSGTENTVIGTSAGRSITTGSSNTFIGNASGFNASQLVSATNSTALGNGSFTDKSNQMVFGNASVSEFKFDRNTSAIVLMPQLQTISANANLFERTSTATNSGLGAILLRHTTSGDMVDGFASNLVFQIRDNANVDNNVAFISGIRSGADNSGRLAFFTATSGSLVERMTVLPNGNTGIGINNPLASLHIASPTTATYNRVIKVGTGSDTDGNGTFIEFPSSVNDNFGSRIGGGRSGLGAQSFLRFDTTNASASTLERMRILANGNVGIGTTAPDGLLHVNGSGGSVISGLSNGTGNFIQFKNATTNVGIIGSDRNILGGSDTSFGIYVYGNNVFDLSTNNIKRLRVDGSGNVGIGTTAPNRILSVSGNGEAIPLQINNISTTAGQLALIRAVVSSDNANTASSIDIGAIRTASSNADFIIRTDNTEKFRILNNGNVGIGTTAPARLLSLVTSSNADGLQIRRNSDTTNEFASLSFRVNLLDNNVDYAQIRAVRTNRVASADTDLTFATISNGTLAERMRIRDDGLVGINETSPTAQLQVKSGATNRVPLIIDTLASHTALLQEWKVNGSIVALVQSTGQISTNSGISNISSINNANVSLPTTGAEIRRNIADSNVALKVNQVHSSSTGDIAHFQFGGTTQANIARDGIANFTGTPSNEQTGDYTLVLADKGKVLRVNSSSNRTITIPKNSVVAFPIDTEIALLRYGTGTVSIAPVDGDVTLNSISSNRKVKDQYGSCALKKIGTDEWVLVGSLEA
jgi:hypothetical protein